MNYNGATIDQPFTLRPNLQPMDVHCVPSGLPVMEYDPELRGYVRMDQNDDWEVAESLSMFNTYVLVAGVDASGDIITVPTTHIFGFRYVGSWGEPD